MEPAVYEKTMRIPHYLGDRYGQVNLPYLMNVLLEVSGEQTAQIGTVPVQELGLHWVIIQYDIEIQRMPNTKEKITIETSTKEHNRLFSYREFEVYDEAGNVLLSVLTVFALINDQRKLSRIPAEVVQGYGSTESRRIRRMPRPKTPEKLTESTRRDYHVRYFDIDTNFHANNSMYFIWMLDVLGDDFLSAHRITSGNIVFEKEVHIGEKVESYVDLIRDEADVLTSRHQIQVDDITKCSGSFTWEEI